MPTREAVVTSTPPADGAARRCMVGFTEWPRDTVLAATLRPIFDALVATLGACVARPAGWWPAAVSDAAVVCLATQGSGMADLVRLCSREPLLYVGLAGGLAPSLDVGDVFAIEGVWHEANYLRGQFVPAAPRKGPVLYADGFLAHEASTLKAAVRRGCLGVEMEWLPALRTAVAEDVACGALMVVSDLPLSLPFHALGASHHARVLAGVAEAARLAAAALPELRSARGEP